ncbi:MAG: UDP-3-O-[3-hydroxymyristoyl] glucosamine N-acyltransferase [Pirellulaceae bacterium]|jgi:UDP-3-O-[3-hydroxymyristoyl] glucosamine N-acyltransferase
MPTYLSDLASLVHGQLHGNGEIPITDASTIRDAELGHITFLNDEKYSRDLATSSASAVLAPPNIEPDNLPTNLPFITVEDVSQSFAAIVEHFRPQRHASVNGTSASAHVAASAKIGKHVTIYPNAIIGDDVEIGENSVIHPGVCIMAGCRIGKNVELFPNVVLYENSVVGDRCTIHANAVIGAYGFGYDTREGRHIRGAQLGYVVLEDDVEIGACATIDRGTFGATSIGEGTKIDNLVQIAHNVRLGKHNIICAQVGIAGSCSTGQYVVMAGQCGIKDHVHLGNQVVLGAKTGVRHDVPDNIRMFGVPGTPEREQMVRQAAVGKLPEMRKDFKKLQKQVAKLEQQINRSEDAA